MSKSNIIGILAAVVIIVSAFLPWLTIESKQLVFTGIDTTGSSFGEPGKVNVFMAAIALLLFATNKWWAGRVNLFISGFLVAWTFRNYLLFSRVEMGEWPHPEIGLYLSLIGSIVSLVCVLMMKVKKKEA
jgi:phosphatidylserine synthase